MTSTSSNAVPESRASSTKHIKKAKSQTRNGDSPDDAVSRLTRLKLSSDELKSGSNVFSALNNEQNENASSEKYDDGDGDFFGRPFEYAIRDGDLETVQSTLTKMGYGRRTRERLNQMDSNGYTPLSIAAKFDRSLIVEMLIEAKAEVTKYSNAALFMAARWGKNEVLPVLIGARADIECCPHGITPLVLAVRGNHMETVMLLVECEADVNSSSGKGRTVLNVAWDSGFLEMVRLLVSNGAKLTDGMWMEASASPNLCFNLGEGLTERIRKLGHDDIPVITLPALYAWVENAPDACVPLLDIVLLKEMIDGVPTRADLGGRSLLSIYTRSPVFDRKDESFKRLCPPDRGKGCTVRIRTLEVKGILRTRMLYALAVTPSRHIFSSVTVQALLDMSFFSYIFNIFMADIAIEIVMLLLFWLNLFALGAYNDYLYRVSRLAVLLILFIVSLRDMVLECIVFSFGRSVRSGIWCNLRFLRTAFLMPNFILVFYVLLCGEMFDLSGSSDLEHKQPPYIPIVAISTFLRYFRLLYMSMEFRIIGIKTLPIFHALLKIGAFALLFFLMLFAFIHAIYVFYYDNKLYAGLIEFATRQVALGMVTRWPIFMNAFTRDDERYLWLLMWYLLASFAIVIILLQMFVGVLRTAYDDEKLFAHATFLSQKSNTCFEYFLFRHRGADLHGLKERILKMLGTFRTPPADGVMWVCEKTEEDRAGEEESGSVAEERQAFESLQKLLSDSTEAIKTGLDRVLQLECKVEQVVQKAYIGLSAEKRIHLVAMLSQGLERRTRDDRQEFKLHKMGKSNRGKFTAANLFGSSTVQK
eukprot:GEMP01001090.1.p1 GENE.GEMP01001090.1~~GEMP01001090.1.p1  ORF type:complete len:815 (+),score=144.30 GEMP01001090.1:138-2582(+)